MKPNLSHLVTQTEPGTLKYIHCEAPASIRCRRRTKPFLCICVSYILLCVEHHSYQSWTYMPIKNSNSKYHKKICTGRFSILLQWYGKPYESYPSHFL